MDKLITIYHGSEKNIEQPIFGEGKKNNDFIHFPNLHSYHHYYITIVIASQLFHIICITKVI